MKKLILILFMAIAISVYASKFDDGFAKGYERGYCNNEVGCVAPVAPVAPVPTVNQSMDSWQDGYDAGYTKGKKAREDK